VVVKDVPPHSTAVGVPARIVTQRDPLTGETRRVEQLPDPEGEMLRGLRAKVLELEDRLTEVEVATDHHHMEHHLSYDALPAQLWATLGENGKEDEFISGAGI
jgi:serine O-acetyltransferase